jgi:hypothetical protein
VGSRERPRRVPDLVFVQDKRTGHGHIVDRGSFGVPSAVTVCGHRMDLREPLTSWPVFGGDGGHLECLRCLRSVP